MMGIFLIKGEIVEEIVVISGLIGTQLVYASNSIFLNYFMLLGINPLTIIIFSSLATFFILALPSFFFERSKWPKKLSSRLMIQLILISTGGVTLFQTLFLKGIELTSPAMATAMPNLAPALIFVIAAAFRVEKIKLSCIYSKLKIVGTILCVIGAFTMSIMQSTTQTPIAKKEMLLTPPNDSLFDMQKIIGCIYLLASVLVLSTNIVMQAWTLAEFPAPITLCTITSILGVMVTTILELIQYRKFDYGWPILSFRELVGYSLLGGIISGFCVSFNGWAMKKRGPVLVSMFSPIGTVISVILSYITLGELMSIGTFASMVLMFTGLYFFLWAKGKEDRFFLVHNTDGDEEASKLKKDVEKPLLS